MTSTDTCRTCKFWTYANPMGQNGHPWGTCRRHAPAYQDKGVGAPRGWPVTYRNESCGDFEQADAEKLASNDQ